MLPLRKPGHRKSDSIAHPALADLRAVERDLREERIDDAWVDLENAALCLRCETTPRPLVAKALAGVERTRELLARADTRSAIAAITGAALLLAAL